MQNNLSKIEAIISVQIDMNSFVHYHEPMVCRNARLEVIKQTQSKQINTWQ